MGLVLLVWAGRAGPGTGAPAGVVALVDSGGRHLGSLPVTVLGGQRWLPLDAVAESLGLTIQVVALADRIELGSRAGVFGCHVERRWCQWESRVQDRMGTRRVVLREGPRILAGRPVMEVGDVVRSLRWLMALRVYDRVDDGLIVVTSGSDHGGTPLVPLGGPQVLIDPAHGGGDAGLRRDPDLEKDLTLRVARRLEAALVEAGVRVELTRSADVTLSRDARAGRANRRHPQALVVLHVADRPGVYVRPVRGEAPAVPLGLAPWEAAHRAAAGRSRRLQSYLARALKLDKSRVGELDLRDLEGLTPPAVALLLSFADVRGRLELRLDQIVQALTAWVRPTPADDAQGAGRGA